MNYFIQSTALAVYLIGDVAVKVLFLIWMIYRHRNGHPLPNPFGWVRRKISMRWCQQRMEKYPCDKCVNYDPRRTIFDEIDEHDPCNGCSVSKILTFRAPSNWEVKDG